MIAGDTVNVSQPSVSRIIHRVSLVIVTRLNHFISYPTNPADIMPIRLQFEVTLFGFRFTQSLTMVLQAIAGFPGVLGCIDGTLIIIKRPKENEDEYVRRKEGQRVNIGSRCFSVHQSLKLFLLEA